MPPKEEEKGKALRKSRFSKKCKHKTGFKNKSWASASRSASLSTTWQDVSSMLEALARRALVTELTWPAWPMREPPLFRLPGTVRRGKVVSPSPKPGEYTD